MKITIERETLERAIRWHKSRIWPGPDEVAVFAALQAALAAQPAEPVAEVHAAHLRSSDENGGHWCREVLLYSGNSPHDWLNGKNTRVKLYAAAPPAPAAVPLTECNDNDSPWLICKTCAQTGQCKQVCGMRPLTADFIDKHIGPDEGDREAVTAIVREVERAHGIAAGDKP